MRAYRCPVCRADIQIRQSSGYRNQAYTCPDCGQRHLKIPRFNRELLRLPREHRPTCCDTPLQLGGSDVAYTWACPRCGLKYYDPDAPREAIPC